jgi:hypothetical protein
MAYHLCSHPSRENYLYFWQDLFQLLDNNLSMAIVVGRTLTEQNEVISFAQVLD